MNAKSIVVGGSTAKQIDCGLVGTGTSSVAVTFNFTFSNIPKVVCTVIGNLGTTTMCSCDVYGITTTGFNLNVIFFNTSLSWGYIGSGYNISWIAIG